MRFNHKIISDTLSSGDTLVTIVAPEIAIASIGIFFEAGARFDPIGKEGLAHMFEHLLTKETEKFHHQIDRLRAIESLGIYANAFTGYETAFYYHLQPTDQITPSLELLLDGVFGSTVSEAMLNKERAIILEEESRNRQDPFAYMWRLSHQALWSSDTLGRDLMGSSDSLKSISIEDVQAFKKKYYDSAPVTFVLISDKYSDLPKTIIDRYRQQQKADVHKIQRRVSVINTNPTALQFKADHRDTESVTIGVHFKTAEAESLDVIGLDLLVHILANHWVSILNQKLRLENDITYWVEGSSIYYSDSGSLSLMFSCQKDKSSRAISLVSQAVKQLRDSLIDDELLNTYKQAMLGDTLRRFTNPFACLEWYGSETYKKTILSIADYCHQIEKITAQEVQTIAIKYLQKESSAVTSIGPTDDTLNLDI